MMAGALLSAVAPFLLGFALVRSAWEAGIDLRARLLQITLGAAVGVGISSCTFFLWLTKPFPIPAKLDVVEPLLFFCAAGVLFLLKKRSVFSAEGSPGSPAPSLAGVRAPDSGKGLLISFYFVLACAIAAMILVLMDKPQGLGDSWSIWNLRARFLFRGGDQWTRGFSSYLPHPDYPLLLPLSVARLWTYMGLETLIVPQMVSVLFTLSTIALLVSSLSVLRSLRHGVAAALFLMATPFFIRMGSSQYADVPVGFFILATMVLLALKDMTNGENRWLCCLSGAMAGFAAWTKNEGILFVACMFAAGVLTLLWKREYKRRLGEWSLFLAGCLPVLAVLAFFKLHYAPPNDVLQAENLRLFMGRAGDFHRYALIAWDFGKNIIHWGNYLLPVMVLYALSSGNGLNRRYLPTVLLGSIVLVLMFSGFFFVYLLSPYDLHWHLRTSLERLLLQLWPAFLFVVFLALNPVPESRPGKG